MAKNKKLSEALRITIRCIRDVNRYIPGRIPSIVLNSVVSALTPYVTIWFSAQLINELAGPRRPEVLWRWVILTVGITALMSLAGAALKRWKSAMQSIHNPRKEQIFTDKFLSMDYADIDNQHIRDLRAQIEQNENWSGWGFNMAVGNLESITQAVIGILGGIALTVNLFVLPVPESAGKLVVLNNPLFALALLAVMAAITAFSTKCVSVLNRRWAESAEEATFGNRLFSSFCRTAEDAKRRLDIRIYNQQELSIHYMRRENAFGPGSNFDRLMKGPLSLLASAAEGSAAIFTGFVYVFVCLKAWAGAFRVGSVTQYVGAVTALSQNISQLLGSVARMKNNAAFLQTTYELLDTPNAMYQGSLTTEKRADRQYEVEFKDVSFRYPGSDLWALHHVNMKFKVGKRLAIVGENGSGKTTFIKLLCRLYDPQEGQILLNGIDIRKYNYRDYMDIFSVVFQDFQLLSQPLGANVAGSADYDREQVRKALIDAGFGERLETMPDGLDTLLYKDFAENGVEVSGGEAQKIAIARALYKDAPFLILDEPTAALDPIAEAEIYSKLNDIVGDKTAIFISHRLSSCKFCDEIAVFHEGEVIQQGSHAELAADESGKYYELWHTQAQYYIENEAY